MSAIWPYIPFLLNGLVLTLKVAVGGFLCGIFIALPAIYLWEFAPRFIRLFITAYVSVIRGLPELLIIFLVYYGGTVILTKIFATYVEVNALAAGIFALAVVSGAYCIEILRSALQNIPAGQNEAAKSLGLSKSTTFFRILTPQMFSHALPGLGNQWLITLKDSALVSLVGTEELMRKTVIVTSIPPRDKPMTFYLIAAALYIAVTGISMLLLKAVNFHLERRK